MRPSTTHATTHDAPPQPPSLITTPPSHSRMLPHQEEVIDLVTPPHTYPYSVATFDDITSGNSYNATRTQVPTVRDTNVRMTIEPVLPQVPTRNQEDISNPSSSSSLHQALFGESREPTLGVGNATAPFDYSSFAQMPPPLTSGEY